MGRWFVLWLALLSPAWLAACTQANGHDEIRMGLAQAPLNLDPRYASDAASARINRLIYRSLVDFDPQSRPIPQLASWRMIDPEHYRFTLRPERAAFHDGKPLQAADVVATYQSLLALKDSPHAAEFANIQAIKQADVDTVDFYLHAPDENFPARLIIGILPARLIAQGHDFAHHPIGSGPLEFLSWHGAVRLQRVADGQRFVLEEVRDPTVRVLKLLRGEIDLLQGDLLPEMVDYLKHKPGIRLVESPGANFSYLGFNLQDPVLAKLEVRRAIAHAINRPAIIRYALVDASREAGAILPPEHWAGNGELPPYDYNPQLARALLEKAGVRLPLRLTYKTSTDAQRVRLATMMQAQMRPAGIALDIRSLDWGTFFDDVKHGKFQLYGLTWVGLKTPEIYRLAFHSAAVPPKGANRGRYRDSITDALIEQGDWQAVSRRVHAQLPYVPLWYEGQFVAMRQGLAGYILQPDGNWDGLATIRRHHAD